VRAYFYIAIASLMNNEEGDNVMKSESYVSALFERSETYRFNKKILSDINYLME